MNDWAIQRLRQHIYYRERRRHYLGAALWVGVLLAFLFIAWGGK